MTKEQEETVDWLLNETAKAILTVIGARPQIIKAAALSRAIKNSFSY